MKKLSYILGLFLLGYAGASAQCTPAAASIYTFFYNGARYELIKENLSWEDAAACALSRGGKLAEILSKAKQDSISYYLDAAGIMPSTTVASDGGGASYVWVGGHDKRSEGYWNWDGDNNLMNDVFFFSGQYPSGKTPYGAYSNWVKENPDDSGGQDALGLAITDWSDGTKGQWNDLSTSNKLYYLVEYPKLCGMSKDLHLSEQWGSPILMVKEPYETYQWVTCPGFVPMSLADEGIFHLKEGSFAVIVTSQKATCIDTSDCYSYSSTGIKEQGEKEIVARLLTVDPYQGFYRLELPQNVGSSIISIMNTSGREVYRETTAEEQLDIDLGLLPSDLYILKLQNEHVEYTPEKIIKL